MSMKRIHSSLSCSLAVGALAARAWAGDVSVTVDLSKSAPAISIYVYGQFIEHLGRCIHDGIWAEKLRDRKFLLSLTNSP